MPVVSFKVAGSDLTSYFEKVKREGAALSSEFIENAKREATSAKEQLKLIDAQVAALEKRNRTAEFSSKLYSRSNVESRLGNIEGREELIGNLAAANYKRFKNKEITLEEYEARGERIEALGTKNTEKNIVSEYRDFLRRDRERYAEEKIKTRLAKENIDAVKQGAKDNVTAVRQGDAKIEDILGSAQNSDEELAARLAKEQLEKDKNSEKKKSKEDGLGNLISGAALTATAVSMINKFAQFSQTQSGFDLIQPARQLSGGMIGGAIGAGIGAVVAALTGGSALPLIGTFASGGAALGSAVGGAEGGLEQRIAIAKQDYEASRNRYIATTGTDRKFGVSPMDEVGLSSSDYIKLMRETARQSGYATNAERYAQETFYADKGYGVDQSTSMALIELQRSSRDNNKELGNIIGGVLEKGKNTIFKGGDQTFLNEFLTKFTQLQKTLLRTQDTISSGTTFDILERFNSMGGQFASRDPRSMGLIETIQNALVNPGSDNLKAASFLALRRANPNLDYFDLMKEQQKGYGSSTYMKSMMEMVLSMGGNADMQKMNIARAFGLSGNLAAAETLFNNRDKIIKQGFSEKELRGLIDKDKAVENTTVMEKKTAEISDSILKDWNTAVKVMASAFEDAMYEAAHGISIQLNENGKYVPVKDNQHKTPSSSKTSVKSLIKDTDWMNMYNY